MAPKSSWYFPDYDRSILKTLSRECDNLCTGDSRALLITGENDYTSCLNFCLRHCPTPKGGSASITGFKLGQKDEVALGSDFAIILVDNSLFKIAIYEAKLIDSAKGKLNDRTKSGGKSRFMEQLRKQKQVKNVAHFSIFYTRGTKLQQKLASSTYPPNSICMNSADVEQFWSKRKGNKTKFWSLTQFYTMFSSMQRHLFSFEESIDRLARCKVGTAMTQDSAKNLLREWPNQMCATVYCSDAASRNAWNRIAGP